MGRSKIHMQAGCITVSIIHSNRASINNVIKNKLSVAFITFSFPNSLNIAEHFNSQLGVCIGLLLSFSLQFRSFQQHYFLDGENR